MLPRNPLRINKRPVPAPSLVKHLAAKWVTAIILLVGCAATPPTSTGLAQESLPAPPAKHHERPPPEESHARCQVDFERARELVENSYAGYADKVEALGRETTDAATRTATEKVHNLDAADRACEDSIRAWVTTFSDRHLSLMVPGQGKRDGDSREPELGYKKISDSAVLLRIETFSKAAELLRIMQEHQAEIESAERVLVDLRGNSGGDDIAYEPLMDLIYTGPYKTFGSDILATEDNAIGWESMIPRLGPGPRQKMVPWFRDTVARIRASSGGFIMMSKTRIVSRNRVLPRPLHVDLFIDGQCASSCEALLLEARHSSKVTTYGSHSAGVLDYQNVRYAMLPSEKQYLGWPTTRSRRLPDYPIDGVGFAPDVPLDPEVVATLDGKTMARLATTSR